MPEQISLGLELFRSDDNPEIRMECDQTTNPNPGLHPRLDQGTPKLRPEAKRPLHGQVGTRISRWNENPVRGRCADAETQAPQHEV